jgi:hypothetical protein
MTEDSKPRMGSATIEEEEGQMGNADWHSAPNPILTDTPAKAKLGKQTREGALYPHGPPARRQIWGERRLIVTPQAVRIWA